MKNTRLGMVCALTALLAVVVVGNAVDAEARAGASTGREMAADAHDAVAVHIAVLEWRPAPDDYAAIIAGESPDLAALAQNKNAQTRVLHVFDFIQRTGQDVRVRSAAQTPYVRGRKGSNDDAPVAVGYEDVGCSVDMMCAWADPADRSRVWASMAIEIADLVSDTALAREEGVVAPLHVKSSYRCDLAADLGEPISFVSLSTQQGGAVAGEGALAYIFQVRFDASPRH